MADGAARHAPAELAERTGTHERYVREWLNTQAAGGFVDLRPRRRQLHAPARARARARRRDEPGVHDRRLPVRERRRRHPRARWPSASSTGDGVGWHEHHHDLCARHRALRSAPATARTSSPDWLPALDGVVERLEAGARVADVGCGHGASTILMAQAFPASPFVGIDYHAGSIETARRARRGGRRRATASRSRSAGAADYVGSGYDLVAFFDALPRPRRPGRRGPARPRGARPGRHRACSSSRSPATGSRTTSTRRAHVLRVLDAVLHAGLALAAGPGRAGHAGRRGAAARGAAEAGFGSVRRAAETPLNLVLEARR